MHPILFKAGFITVYSYGVMLSLAFLLAVFFAGRQAQKQNIPAEKIWDLGFVLIIAGIIGARILFIALNLRFYLSAAWWEIFMLHHGGLVFYGGLISALIGGVIFLKYNNLPILSMADLVIPYVALAQAIGRLGCFLNGCCYGRVTHLFLGIRFPHNDNSLHPTQLYSAVFLFLLFLGLAGIGRRRKFAGQVFILYFIFYGIGRFIVEFFRGDNPIFFAGLTVSQVLSAVAIILASVMYWRIRPRE